MRIFIVSDAWYPQINGVVRTYEHLIKALEEKGHEICITGPSEYPFAYPMPGYPEIKLAFITGRKLNQKIQEFKPDAIHIATEGPLGASVRRQCQRHGWAYTSAYHTRFPQYVSRRLASFAPILETSSEKYTTQYMRRFHNDSSLVFTATASLEADLRESGFTTLFHRLTRGVDLQIFTPDGPKADLNIKAPIALYVGRIALEKNLEDFLDADWPGSKVLIGHGPNLEMLQSRYPQAHFLGPKTGEDLAAHYRASDIFVFPSKTDTFGIVLIEALACGLPVAAYPVMGPCDIITQDKLGALDENLQNAMEQALRQSRASPSKARADHIKKYYTWDLAAGQFIQGLEKIKALSSCFAL